MRSFGHTATDDPLYLGADDFDGDNTIGTTDFAQFTSNFLRSLPTAAAEFDAAPLLSRCIEVRGRFEAEAVNFSPSSLGFAGGEGRGEGAESLAEY
jgi:hypothetical protein